MGRLPRTPPRVGGVPVSTRTMKDLAAAAIDMATGRSVPLPVAQERWDVCQQCPAFNGKRCTMCGCFMRKKVGLPSATCPLNKWPR